MAKLFIALVGDMGCGFRAIGPYCSGDKAFSENYKAEGSNVCTLALRAPQGISSTTTVEEVRDIQASLKAKGEALAEMANEKDELAGKLSSTQRALDEERAQHALDLHGLANAAAGQAYGEGLSAAALMAVREVNQVFTNWRHFEQLWKGAGGGKLETLQQAADIRLKTIEKLNRCCAKLDQQVTHLSTECNTWEETHKKAQDALVKANLRADRLERFSEHWQAFVDAFDAWTREQRDGVVGSKGVDLLDARNDLERRIVAFKAGTESVKESAPTSATPEPSSSDNCKMTRFRVVEIGSFRIEWTTNGLSVTPAASYEP